MSGDSFYNNSIFWIEVNKIRPNPYQPRREFDEVKLQELSESIRQYGVLQPIVLTRQEVTKEDGGLSVEYELIAGERRWRAAKLAGLTQIPATIRTGEQTDKAKLELAIIENLQREDLNPVDRALAFEQLAKEFNFKHTDIAKRVGRSREFVSNSLRLLGLTDEMRNALTGKTITEGHARTLLMLTDRPEEQATLFKEIVTRKLSVRETEQIARRIAREKMRRKEDLNPEIAELEQELTETFGTRVQIQQKESDGKIGGKVVIEYFSPEDFQHVLTLLKQQEDENNAVVEEGELSREDFPSAPSEEGEDIYSVKHFSL